MKLPRSFVATWFVLAFSAGIIAEPRSASPQSGVMRNGVTALSTTNNQPLLPPDSSAAPGVPANPTLEIAPHVIATPPPAAMATPPAPADDDDTSDAAGTLDDALHQHSAKPIPQGGETTPGLKRPYIGLAAQFIETHDPPWHTVKGLEVVSIDPGSPAALAGLKGRGAMSSVGESGATASAMMAPLDLIMMPILKKTGSLGASGDLIVAIDDQRVDRADALKNALDQTKPGDMLYLTIVRTADGKNTTMKVPVKLADAHQAAVNSTSDTASNSGSGN